MFKPKIRVRYFGLIIILSLLFLLPMNACAQENLATAEIVPVPSITLNSTALNQIIVPGKNPGLPDSSNPVLKDSHPQGQVNTQEKFFNTDSRSGQKYVKDRVIVRFKSQKNTVASLSNEKIRMAHAKVGAKVEEDFTARGIDGLQVVQLPEGTDVQSAVKLYKSNPDVLYAEPDYVISIIPDETGPIIHDGNSPQILSNPDDSYFSNQWSFDNTGQTGGTVDADIDAPEAWANTTGSDSVVVAVIDTGVLYNHNDLSSNIWNNKGEIPDNGVDDDGNGYIDDIRGWNFVNSTNDPVDDQEHGTHVSGIIGAVGNNALGVAGVSWHVKIMPLKAFDQYGQGSTLDAIKAIEYANANGASVISNSWGGPDPSQALKDAIDASPAVVVCAAGNGNGNDNDFFPVYPASYSSPNIISVTATDNNDTLASFSNIGLSSVDLAAPGTNILSTYYLGNYVTMSGTSMATPHVSGVVVLVKAMNPSLTSTQIKNIILSTVDVKSSLSGKVASGGRLNAYNAVMASNPPVADFIGTPRSGTSPITVVFTDLSANTPTSWNWTFGDGSIVNATLRNPVHTYMSSGNFTVSLNVTNAAGFNSTTKVRYINLTNSTTKIGVTNGQQWYLDWNGNGVFDSGVDKAYSFGAPGWTPIIGDWNSTGKSSIGVTNGQQWYLDWDGNGVFDGGVDKAYSFGAPGWTPIIGDWNSTGKSSIGVTNGQQWYLDWDGNGVFEGGVDKTYSFGAPDWIPVVGNWC
jgi:thermitase